MAQEIDIFYMRIHGWGVVSSEDHDLYSLSAVDNSAGTAVFTITGTTNTITSDQAGSEVWIESVPGLADDFYTLYLAFSLGGNTLVYIKGDPDNFSASTGPMPLGAIIRIEDHYKLCTDIPDWITGSGARSRWLPRLTDITPTLSAEIEVNGGIGKIDGISISHNYIFEGFDKTRFKVMNEDDNVQSYDEMIFNQARVINIPVRNGIPYMGSYDNPNTAPSLGLYEPTWWGSECIRVDSATGSGPYLMDITRGLLRTQRQVHLYGSLFFDGFTTPLGKDCDIIKSKRGVDRYSEGELILSGPISSGDYGEGVVAQSLAISSDLLRTVRKRASDILPIKWRESVNEIQYFTPYGRNWQWVQIGEAAFRLMGLHNKDTIDYPGSKRFDIIVAEDDARRNYFGYARVISAVIDRRYVDIDGQTVGNGIMVKTNKDPNVFAKYNYANLPVAAAANIRYPDVNDEAREQFIENFSKNFLFWPNVAQLGSPIYDFNVIREYESDLELCHVFEPQYFGPDNSFEYTSTTVPVIGINPIDLLLQILLTDFGDGTNTFTFEGTTYDFDVLPPDLGLRFKADQIDLQSFMKAAAQFDENGIAYYNVSIKQEDSDDMARWLSNNILEPLFLSLVTDSKGKLVLTQLADSARRPDMVTLTNSDLFNTIDGDSINLQRDISGLLTKITYEIERPYITPSNPSFKDVVNYRYAFDGITAHYEQLGQSDVKFKLKFSPFQTTSDSEAFTGYLGRFLSNRRVPITTITCYVDADFEPDNFLVGRYQMIDLQYLPNAFDEDTTNLFGVGLVISRKKDILQGIDQLKIAVVETLNTDRLITYGPSAEVDSGSTGTVIQLVDSMYIPSFVSSYDSDADSFGVGAYLWLLDENFTLRSTDSIPKITAINSATEIEIDTDFEDSGGPITPNAGDIIVLAEKSQQTQDAALQNFAYVFSSRTNASYWESN